MNELRLPNVDEHSARYRFQPKAEWARVESFQTGFRKTIEWDLENQNWWEKILDGSCKLESLGKIS
jgi:dTDP-glucose 4,6-dehydratase